MTGDMSAESFCIYALCGMRVRSMIILANLLLSSDYPEGMGRFVRQKLDSVLLR